MKRLRIVVTGAAIAAMLTTAALAGEQAARRTPPAPSTPSGKTTQGAQPRAGAPPRTPKPQTAAPAVRGAVPRTARRPTIVAPYYRYRPYVYDAYRYGLGFYYGVPFLYPGYDLYWYDYPYRYPPSYYGWGDPNIAYGSVRLQIPQKEAAVYVDGYFIGTVDEFDSALAPLALPVGPHRLEIRASGYETLTIEVYVTLHRMITYRGTLRPVQTEPQGPTP